jgi:hypothetical protein
MTDNNQYRENIIEGRRAHDRLDAFLAAINDSTVKSADAVLRNCLLINGGAAVAILAFMGALSSKNSGSGKIIEDIADGLTYFAWGVIAAVAALGLSYIVHFATYKHAASQNKVWENPYLTPGKSTPYWAGLKIGLHVVAVVLAVVSGVLFVIGLFAVKHAVTSFPS